MTTKRTPHPVAGYAALRAELRFNEQGLIPTVIQDRTSGAVLTLCYLNEEALKRSLSEGRVYVFRRSLGRLMLKGESSGHVQHIREAAPDCEGRSLLLIVDQHIAGCHTGYFSCYYRRVNRDGELTAQGTRIFDPSKVYKKAA